jgi:hypothetical protein
MSKFWIKTLYDYVINIEKKEPDFNNVVSAFYKLTSGEINYLFTSDERGNVKVDTESFLKDLNTINFSKHLLSDLKTFEKELVDNYEVLSHLFSRYIDYSVTSRPNDSFTYILSADNVFHSENLVVSDSLYCKPLSEKILREVENNKEFELEKVRNNILKVTKPKEDSTGFAVAIIRDGEGFAYRIDNTSSVSYFNLPEMHNSKVMVNCIDKKSRIELCECFFQGTGEAYFNVPAKVYNSISDMVIYSNVKQSMFDVSFLNEGYFFGTQDLEVLGNYDNKTGYILDKRPTENDVILKIILPAISTGVLPSIKFLGLR